MREDGNYVSFFTWCKATQCHFLSWCRTLNGVIFHDGCYLSVVKWIWEFRPLCGVPRLACEDILYLSFLLLVSGPHEPRIEYLWLALGANDANPEQEEAVVMYGHESWTSHMKKAKHPRTDAFERWCWRRLESPLDSKEINPVNPKGNQPWIFIGRADAEAETLILWPRDTKNWLTGKEPDAGKDWRQEEKGTTEDEMVGRHH